MACIRKCYTDYRIAMLNEDVRLVETAVRAFEKVLKKYTNFPECAFCYHYYRKVYTTTCNFFKKDNWNKKEMRVTNYYRLHFDSLLKFSIIFR